MPPDSEREMAVEPCLVEQDGRHLLELVEVDFLRHDPEAGLRRLEFAIDVMPEHADAAAGLVDQRRDDADRGRLAGAVGSEQREEIPFFDVEVDALQRLHAVAVGLAELAQRQCLHGVQ
jgi:hypothetical protein